MGVSEIYLKSFTPLQCYSYNTFTTLQSVWSLKNSSCDTHLSHNILQFPHYSWMFPEFFILERPPLADFTPMLGITSWSLFSALILLHLSNAWYLGTMRCLLSLSVVLFFLIFAYVLLWPPSYFPSNHPPCILGMELPDIVLNNLCFFFVLSLLDFKSYWEQGFCLAHHWISNV